MFLSDEFPLSSSWLPSYCACVSLTAQLEKIREIAVVLEEWVPPGEDGADDAALDEMDALAAQAPLPSTIQEGQEEQENPQEGEKAVFGGDDPADPAAAADVVGGHEVEEEGTEEEGARLPNYEELLPPAPVKGGPDAAAAATELNGDDSVGGVAVETAPADGSDVLVEETKGSPVPA